MKESLRALVALYDKIERKDKDKAIGMAKDLYVTPSVGKEERRMIIIKHPRMAGKVMSAGGVNFVFDHNGLCKVSPLNVTQCASLCRSRPGFELVDGGGSKYLHLIEKAVGTDEVEEKVQELKIITEVKKVVSAEKKRIGSKKKKKPTTRKKKSKSKAVSQEA